MKHGTRESYKRGKCRCEPCRGAERQYQLAYQQRFRETPDDPRHGTLRGYKQLGCRCDKCCATELLYRKPKGVPQQPINHGTTAGYRMHWLRKVPICDACRAANRKARGKGGPPRWTPIGHNTYLGVHADLRKRRGPARDHRCPCGDQAAHWAYITSPNEKVDADGRKFSSDLDDYAPRCIPCHHRMDHPPPSHCPKGHAYEGGNLLVDRRGRRSCRECKRDRSRASNLTPEQLARKRESRRESERKRRERDRQAREQGDA